MRLGQTMSALLCGVLMTVSAWVVQAQQAIPGPIKLSVYKTTLEEPNHYWNASFFGGSFSDLVQAGLVNHRKSE